MCGLETEHEPESGNPEKLKRFKSIKRGYYSFVIFSVLVVISLLAELLVNSRALAVSYQGEIYFPTYGDVIPGQHFGLDYEYETNYRQLQAKLAQEAKGDWVLLPLVPWNPYEQDFKEEAYPPYAPSLAERHFLGTDTSGRDVLARLVYGFRIAIGFAFITLVASYVIGVSIGCMMGFLGGRFDLVLQRFIENLVPGAVSLRHHDPGVAGQAELRPVRGHQRAVRLDGDHLVHAHPHLQGAGAGLCDGGAGARGDHPAHHLQPYPAQYPDDDRHPGAVRRGGQYLHPDGAGLSGLRPGAANPELGGIALPGDRQPGCHLDRELRGGGSEPGAASWSPSSARRSARRSIRANLPVISDPGHASGPWVSQTLN